MWRLHRRTEWIFTGWWHPLFCRFIELHASKHLWICVYTGNYWKSTSSWPSGTAHFMRNIYPGSQNCKHVISRFRNRSELAIRLSCSYSYSEHSWMFQLWVLDTIHHKKNDTTIEMILFSILSVLKTEKSILFFSFRCVCLFYHTSQLINNNKFQNRFLLPVR